MLPDSAVRNEGDVIPSDPEGLPNCFETLPRCAQPSNFNDLLGSQLHAGVAFATVIGMMLSAFAIAIGGIVASGSQKEMRRIATRRVIATVTDHQAVRNWAYGKPVCDSVTTLGNVPVGMELPIPHAAPGEPRPARFCPTRSINTCPEQRGDCAGNLGSHRGLTSVVPAPGHVSGAGAFARSFYSVEVRSGRSN